LARAQPGSSRISSFACFIASQERPSVPAGGQSMLRRIFLVMALSLLGWTAQASPPNPPACTICDAWGAPQTPFRIYGNTYYVGVHGLSSLLIDSGKGLMLIDGDLPQSPPQIVAHIKALGFDPANIKLILNSHAHFDHAGGINELQHLTGAPVLASAWSAKVMRAGGVGREDPQYGVPAPIDPIEHVRVVRDGQTVRLGNLAITAHYTPGHTPGGTSWTWMSCESGRCLNMVYADSLNAVSAPGFLFSHNTSYPQALSDFEKSFAVVSALPCDILLTPHPDVSDTLGKWQRREQGAAPDPFIDSNACLTFVAKARQDLAARVEKEKSGTQK
jgi:metallo-beta-lactamase class B